MTPRNLPYHNSPFAHLVFLVSEALKGPAVGAPGSTPWPASGWLERLDRWLWTQRRKDVEAYLAQSQDLADLERRMREIDRTVASRYY